MSEQNKIDTLAEYLGCETDELTETNYDDRIFEYGNREYMILTDDEANDIATEYIKDSLWAFNAEFIISHSKLPYESIEMIKSYQDSKCESANDTIAALIDDIDEFIDDAISADGRGHFLNTYDGNEEELNGFYIYRVN